MGGRPLILSFRPPPEIGDCGRMGRVHGQNREKRQGMAGEANAPTIQGLSRGRNGTGVHRSLLEREGVGNLSLRLLRRAVVFLGNKIRFRNGMAEFLQARRGGRLGRTSRPRLLDDSDRSPMREMWRSPGPCIRGRSPSHGTALLHQFRVVVAEEKRRIAARRA